MHEVVEVEVRESGKPAGSFQVRESPAVIGRDRAAAVLLDSQFVSKVHARLFFDGSGMRLVDAASSNGFTIAGAAVREAQIGPDDVVVICDFELRFRLLGSVSDIQPIKLKVLELSSGATWEEVKQTYRDLAQIWHPDRFAHNERLRDSAERKLKDINDAYDWLKKNWRDSVRSHGSATRFYQGHVPPPDAKPSRPPPSRPQSPPSRPPPSRQSSLQSANLRLVAGLAVAAVLFGGGTALSLLLQAPSLRLSSTPPGATVTLDGTAVCPATPCVTGALAPGDHELVVTREGYRPLNVTVTVPSRGEREVPTFVLSADDGDERARLVRFTLTSRPPGASVILNGKNLGRTPLEVSLQEGALATLRLELKDYLPHTETFTVSSEPRTFELEPAPLVKSPGSEPQIRPEGQGRGTVLFVVEPWAIVVCGSYRFGETPFSAQAMNAGDYLCHFKNTYGEKSQPLHVEPGVFQKVTVRVP